MDMPGPLSLMAIFMHCLSSVMVIKIELFSSLYLIALSTKMANICSIWDISAVIKISGGLEILRVICLFLANKENLV